MADLPQGLLPGAGPEGETPPSPAPEQQHSPEGEFELPSGNRAATPAHAMSEQEGRTLPYYSDVSQTRPKARTYAGSDPAGWPPSYARPPWQGQYGRQGLRPRVTREMAAPMCFTSCAVPAAHMLCHTSQGLRLCVTSHAWLRPCVSHHAQ